MPTPNLSAEIDYYAFDGGIGGANYQLVFQRTFERVHISSRRKKATYGDLITYLNNKGGLEQRNTPSRKAGVPSSILGLPYVGPASARVLIKHLEQRGLLLLLKKSNPKPRRHHQ